MSILMIFIGAFIQGCAMTFFLFPHSVPSGGAAGIAILLNYWLHLPLGLGLWLANFIFLIFALNFFGYTWTIRTMCSVAITSITVSVFSELWTPLYHLLWLDLLCGSCLFGIGVGILIRFGSSSGGMVIPALMIAASRGWKPGKVMLGINLSIFFLTATAINWKIVLYAIVCQSISTRIIDFIIDIQLPTVSSPSYMSRKK